MRWAGTIAQHAFQPGKTFSIAVSRGVKVPIRRPEFSNVTGKDVMWVQEYGHRDPLATNRTTRTSRMITDNRSESLTWGRAPLVPAQQRATVPQGYRATLCAICRQGDHLYPIPRLVEGDATHAQESLQGLKHTYRMYRDGVEVPGTPFRGYPLPAGPSRVRLEGSTVIIGRSDLYALRTDTVWEFTATGRPERNEVVLPYGPPKPLSTEPAAWQPAIFLTYDVPLALDNTTFAGAPQWFTVQAGAGRPGSERDIAGLDLKVSYDDGRTWARAVLVSPLGTGRFGVLLLHPRLDRSSGAVTLQAHAWDRAGNTVTQTVYRAFGLADPVRQAS